MGFIKEFKEFAVKGNVFDMAIGVIFGGAFGNIIDSAVKHLMNPIIAAALGKPDFSSLYIPLGTPKAGFDQSSYAKAVETAGVPLFAYGAFITSVVNFVILALFVFWVVKGVNKMRAPNPAAPAPGPTAQEALLGEIRDLLKK